MAESRRENLATEAATVPRNQSHPHSTGAPPPAQGVGRIAWNGTAYVLAWLWPMFLSLFTIRLFVRLLGDSAYGIFTLVTTVTDVSSLFDLGLTQAGTKFIAQFRAHNDDDGIREVIETNLALTLCLGAGASLIVILVSGSLAAAVVATPGRIRDSAELVFNIGAILLFLKLAGGALTSVLNGFHRYDLTSLVNICVGTAFSLLTIWALQAGTQLEGVVWIRLGITVLGLGFTTWLVKRFVWTGSLRPRIHKESLGTLLRFGVLLNLGYVANILAGPASQFGISALAGAATLGTFAVLSRLASLTHSVCGQFFLVLFPVFSDLKARGSQQQGTQLYRWGMFLTMAVCGAFAVPLGGLAFPILREWLGIGFAAKAGAAMLTMVVAYLLLGLTIVPANLANGTGHPKVTSGALFLHGTSTLLLTILWVPTYGVAGAALAYLVGAALNCICIVSYTERRLLRLPLREGPGLYLRPVVAAVIAGGLGRHFSGYATTLPRLMLLAFTMTATYGLLVGLSLASTRAERRSLEKGITAVRMKLAEVALGTHR